MIKFYFLLSIPSIVLTFSYDSSIQICEKEIFVDSEISHFSKYIVDVVKKDLFYKSTIFIQSKSSDTMTVAEKRVFDTLIHIINFVGVPLVTIDESYSLIGDKNDGNILHIIISEECADLEKLVFEEKIAKYLFILTGDINDCNKSFDKIRNKLIVNKITIAYRDENNKFVFAFASLEMDPNICNVSENLTLNKIDVNWDGEYIRRGESIFPPKHLQNFKQCPLNFGLATLHPYAVIKNKDKKYKNLDPIAESDIIGSDVELLKIIAEYFNATLNFFFILRQEENPFADRGFINLVHNGSLDVCAGGLYRVYGDTVAYSGIYTRQAVVWVYSVAREIRSWQSFVMKVNGLYMFLIFYIIYSVFWKIVCKFDKQSVSMSDILLYGWGALLGATSLQDAKNIKQKIANAMYLIMSLHLSAYISVQLYSYLTIQGPPHFYKTIDELISSGIKPYLKDSSKYFVEDKKYTAFANTSGSCDHFIHCEEVILEKQGTTILIDGFLPSYQADTAIEDEAKVVQVSEEVLFVYHEMTMRKNSFFSEPFRKTILHLFEAGIIEKLYYDAIGIIYVDKAKIANKNVMSNSYSCQAGCKITLTQSAGAFYIWILGCILSLIVLFLEILIRRDRHQSYLG